MRLTPVAAALAAALSACSTGVDPVNPWDGATPPQQQAKARVSGRVVAQGLSSSDGLDVALRQNGALVRLVQTAGGGAFLFADLVPGSYVVEIAPAGFVPATVPLALAAGAEVDLGDLPLAPLLGTDAATLTGVALLEGQPAHGGILVEAVGRAFTAVTASDGAFQLTVSEGTYDLRFTREDFVTATVADVAVARGETRTLETVTLPGNPASVAGTVEGERPDGSSGPLADALVTLEGTAVTGLTGAGGGFTLTGIPAGSYLLRVVKAGYTGVSLPVLNLAGGELRTLAEPLALALGRGAIAGTVELADSADASGVVVELSGTGLAAVTGSSGAFLLEGLVEGVYELSAHKDGYARQVRASLGVVAGATTTAGLLTLTRQGGAISIAEGAVTGARGVTVTLGAATAAGFRASEDPTFSDPAMGDTLASPAAPRPYGGPGSTHPFTLGDADGRHQVYVVFYDGAGTASSPASASIVLDRTAPASPSVVIDGGAAYTRADFVALSLSADDAPATPGAEVSGLASVALSADAAFTAPVVLPFTVGTTWPIGSGDGPRTVYARFTDRAGNVSATAQAAIVRDATSPSNAALALSGGAGAAAGTTGSPLVTAALSADDANEGPGKGNLQVRLANTSGFAGASYQPFAGTLAWFVTPGDGDKTVYAQFRDPAGNESAVASASIALLATPPQAGSLLLEGGVAATSKQIVNVAVSATGASQMRFFVNGVAQPAGWTAYATSATVDLGASPDEATRVVSVSFRNAAGVEGGGTSASIRFDRTAPGAGTLAIAGTLGNGAVSASLTATPAVVLQIAPPAGDATEMAVAQATTAATACSTMFGSPLWQPVARSATLVLTGADGAKRACVLFRDAAGNSAAASAAAAGITLDTTPPSNPGFVNLASGTQRDPLAPASGLPQITASTDVNGVTYQCVGGQGTAYGAQWTDCGTSTTLPSAWWLPANRESTLGIRARDGAFNVSPGSLVRILHDDVAPFPPFIVDLRSSRDSVTVTWDATGDADVVDWVVHYGNAAGDLGGTGAAQGPSPISAGPRTGQVAPSFTLTNLTPGLPCYVSVEAVDAAGNRSGPSGERLAVPNRANPRFLSTFAGLPRSVGAIATATDTFAYVGEHQGIVQLRITSDAALPTVTGRAFLPDLVPDERSKLAVFACSKGATPGHCVLAAGTTLEGDFRRNLDDFRAALPVVFFPIPAGPAQVVGTIEAILPVRPTHVFATSSGGEPLVVTVDGIGVRAFTFKSGNLSFLRQVARADRPNPMRTVLAAGINGPELYVYGVPDVLEQGMAAELEAWELSDVLYGDLYPLAATTVLNDDAGSALGVEGGPDDPPVMILDGGVYAAFVSSSSGGDAVVASYIPGDPDPSSVATIYPGASSDGGAPVAGAAVGNQLYVWVAGGLGSPQVTQVNVSGLALTEGGTAFSTYEPRLAAAILNHASQTRLLTIEPNGIGTSSLQRWNVSGATVAQTLFPFEEIPPEHFAEADHLLYVSHRQRIHAVEVSNPYAPAVIQPTGNYAGRTYGKLLVHGRFLYAVGGTGGLDVFRMNSNGSLTWRANLNPGTVRDVAAAGRWLFVASSAGISAYNATSVATASPTLVQTVASPNGTVTALAARRDSVGTTSYEAVVYALMGVGGDGELRTFTFNGVALSALSGAVSYPGEPGDSLTVKGDYAVAGTPSGSFVLYVGAPASPSVTGAAYYPVSGPAQLQAGYVTGLGAVSSSSGPAFLGRGAGALDGSIRFSTCAADGSGEPGSLAHRDGWYAASCQRNGIALLSPVSVEGGRLLKSHDLSAQWSPGAALATDGMQVWVGGPDVSGDTSRLYQMSEQGTAEGSLSPPSYTSGNNLLDAALVAPDPFRSPVAMIHADGVVHVVTRRIGGSPTVDSYDPSNLPWVRLGRYTFPTTDDPTAIATDGQYLYVARTASATGFSRVDVLDARNPAAVTLRATTAPSAAVRSFTALAVARDRLYAAVAQGTVRWHDILVFDVSGVPAAAPVYTLPALPSVSPGWEGGITGLAVAGRTLAYTVHDAVYRFPRYGLGIARLGTNLDGSGASFPGGSQPTETAEPLQAPVLAGDVLYVASNLGLQSWDLRPWWLAGARPTPVGGVSLPDGFRADAPIRLQLVGPFGYLVGGTVRAFDLR